MNPDKLLSEAEIRIKRIERDPKAQSSDRVMMGREDVLWLCEVAKLALKPRQDAGRPEFWSEERTRYDIGAIGYNMAQQIRALQAYALSLEAKPQPDEGGLKAAKLQGATDMLEAILASGTHGGDFGRKFYAKDVVKLAGQNALTKLAQADAKEGI